MNNAAVMLFLILAAMVFPALIGVGMSLDQDKQYRRTGYRILGEVFLFGLAAAIVLFLIQ